MNPRKQWVRRKHVHFDDSEYKTSAGTIGRYLRIGFYICLVYGTDTYIVSPWEAGTSKLAERAQKNHEVKMITIYSGNDSINIM